MAWPGVSQRMVTMRSPRKGPAGSVGSAVRSTQRSLPVGTPARSSAASKVMPEPIRKQTRSSRQMSVRLLRSSWREPARNRIARIGDLEHRAGALVALAVEQEVEPESLGQDRQVALHEAGREPAAGAADAAGADVAPHPLAV